jgi:hypothetical protein
MDPKLLGPSALSASVLRVDPDFRSECAHHLPGSISDPYRVPFLRLNARVVTSGASAPVVEHAAKRLELPWYRSWLASSDVRAARSAG